MTEEPDPTPTPNFVTCLCQYCDGGIEFDASQAGETVACPHCKLETLLFVPSADPMTRVVAPPAQTPPVPAQRCASDFERGTCGMNIENTVWECFLKAVARFNASKDPQSLLCPRGDNPKTRTEKAAASERAISHRLAFYLESELRRVGLVDDFGPIAVDCEYNRHLVDGKALATEVQEKVQAIVKEARRTELESDEDGFYVFSIAPDILVHQRKTDAKNLLVIEVKKRSNHETEDYDLLKLELFTKTKAGKMGYAYKFGAWVVADDECPPEDRRLQIVKQFKNGVGQDFGA